MQHTENHWDTVIENTIKSNFYQHCLLVSEHALYHNRHRSFCRYGLTANSTFRKHFKLFSSVVLVCILKGQIIFFNLDFVENKFPKTVSKRL